MKQFKYILIALTLCGGFCDTSAGNTEVLTDEDSGKESMNCHILCRSKHLFFNGQHWHDKKIDRDKKSNNVICRCTNIKEHEKPENG